MSGPGRSDDRHALPRGSGGWELGVKVSVGRFLPRLLLGSLLAVSSLCPHTAFPPHVWVLVSFSYEDTRHGIRDKPVTSFSLNYLIKGPVSKNSHPLRYWGWEFTI